MRGRPPVPEQNRRINQAVRLQKWVVDWLDHQKESSGRLIEAALIQFYNLGTSMAKQKLDDDADEYIPALDGALYYLAVIHPNHGSGMAILDEDKWRRTDIRELQRLAEKAPRRGLDRL